MRIIIGIIITALGFLITFKANTIYQEFGAVEWAERYLGTEGGSRLFYKLVGIIAIFVGFLLITNLMGNIILSIFGPLFSGFNTTVATPQ